MKGSVPNPPPPVSNQIPTPFSSSIQSLSVTYHFSFSFTAFKAISAPQGGLSFPRYTHLNLPAFAQVLHLLVPLLFAVTLLQ